MIDDLRLTELVEIFEGSYDKQEEASLLNKEARTMIKDYSERSELNPKTVFEVYKSYVAWRRGRFQWGDDTEADDFTSMLILIMDKVTGKGA